MNSRPPPLVRDSSGIVYSNYRSYARTEDCDEERLHRAAMKRERKANLLEQRT